MRESDERMTIFFEHPDQFEVPEGAEGFDEVLEREGAFLEELVANPKYQDSTILIATHGAALRGLICYMKQSGIARFWEGGVHKNCGVTIVDVVDGKYENAEYGATVKENETYHVKIEVIKYDSYREYKVYINDKFTGLAWGDWDKYTDSLIVSVTALNISAEVSNFEYTIY